VSGAIDLDQLYPVVWEDMYNVDEFDEKASRGRVYELIRSAERSGVSEYKVIIRTRPYPYSGWIELYYQTTGNGFMLWHTFRLRADEWSDDVPVIDMFRYLADDKILLYLNKRGMNNITSYGSPVRNFTLPLFG
jgi:hypothetical protein